MATNTIDKARLWKDPEARWELGVTDHPSGEIALTLSGDHTLDMLGLDARANVDTLLTSFIIGSVSGPCERA